MINFGLVGSGWRAEGFCRIAQLAPDWFRLGGVVSRSVEKRDRIAKTWSVPTFDSTAALLAATQPDFVVVAVGKGQALAVLKELADRDMAILAETPPATDLAGLIEIYQAWCAYPRLQIAEQYHLQPLHAARLKLLQGGEFGPPLQARVSVTQTYHAVSLLRRYLGLGFENATIAAQSFVFPAIAGVGRGGPTETETLTQVERTIATLDFGGRLGVYDFEKDQHRSLVRSTRIEVRCLRGEIDNDMVSRLVSHRQVVRSQLTRRDTGHDANLEGYSLATIAADGQIVYENPYPGCRLSDEEIAMASCLSAMDRLVSGGPGFYCLAEACQDTYLGLLIDEAARTGATVVSQDQPWSKAR